VHATVAGVLLAFTIPTRTYIDRGLFVKSTRWLLDRFEAAAPNSSAAHAAIHSMETQFALVESPSQRIEHFLHPWISFLVMPLFAFANAGVRILGNGLAAATHPVSLGVVLGLLLGKHLGIWLFAWTSAKTGLAYRLQNFRGEVSLERPAGVGLVSRCRCSSPLSRSAKELCWTCQKSEPWLPRWPLGYVEA
jgi:NhaA family Na+:H+ antiporter